jgi:hypothetical protein
MDSPRIEAIKGLHVTYDYHVVSGISAVGQCAKITAEKLVFFSGPVLSIEYFDNRKGL